MDTRLGQSRGNTFAGGPMGRSRSFSPLKGIGRSPTEVMDQACVLGPFLGERRINNKSICAGVSCAGAAALQGSRGAPKAPAQRVTTLRRSRGRRLPGERPGTGSDTTLPARHGRPQHSRFQGPFSSNAAWPGCSHRAALLPSHWQMNCRFSSFWCETLTLSSFLHMQYSLGSSGLCITYLFNSNHFISAKKICSATPAADRLWQKLEAEAPKGGRICLRAEPQLFAAFLCPGNYFDRRTPGGLFGLCTRVLCSQPPVREQTSEPPKTFLLL